MKVFVHRQVSKTCVRDTEDFNYAYSEETEITKKHWVDLISRFRLKIPFSNQTTI